MRSAIYYPYTTVEDEGLIKTALLLWDKLEFIVPWREFSPNYGNQLIARAMELVGSPRVPDEDEKRKTHSHIEEIVRRRLPPQFYVGPGSPHEYEFYPQKLLPQTWDLLQRSRIAGQVLENSDYPMSEPAGLTVMSVLADCCAGSTRVRVTDRGDAYATLSGILGQNVKRAWFGATSPQEQLVPISLKILDLSSINLEQLIRFREREYAEVGSDLSDLRHRYIDALEIYVKKLASEVVTATDAQEIRRNFEDDMQRDLRDLRRELTGARVETFLSKEVLVTTIAAIGTAATWLYGAPAPILDAATTLGAPAAIGGLIVTGNKYLNARRSVLRNHPMAYLYELRSANASWQNLMRSF